jgi:hypothetical protein
MSFVSLEAMFEDRNCPINTIMNIAGHGAIAGAGFTNHQLSITSFPACSTKSELSGG